MAIRFEQLNSEGQEIVIDLIKHKIELTYENFHEFFRKFLRKE